MKAVKRARIVWDLDEHARTRLVLKLQAMVSDRIAHFCYLYRSCHLSFQLSVFSFQFKATATVRAWKNGPTTAPRFPAIEHRIQ